jgi:hypothetical protein
MTLGIKADVLDRKKEYERVPVLRNLLPAQVLMGSPDRRQRRSDRRRHPPSIRTATQHGSTGPITPSPAQPAARPGADGQFLVQHRHLDQRRPADLRPQPDM